MKFAHLADCHIGGWRHPIMRELNIKSFKLTVDSIIEKKVDFVLIAGDLFNTAFPSIDSLKSTFQELKKLKDLDIPVYLIPGSHDFSSSGKTMLDLLEVSGLVTNVFSGEIDDKKLVLKIFEDKKTGCKITGILGKKGQLDKKYYEILDKTNLENVDGKKIFMFHTTLEEFKPKELEGMEGAPLSLLPKGFNYYAGGHVHQILDTIEEEYGRIVFPGPLFPNNFSEIEKLKKGGYFLFNDGELEYINTLPCKIYPLIVDCEGMEPSEVLEEIEEIIPEKLDNTIVTIRLFGKLKGSPSDIDYKSIYRALYDKQAIFVMKNISKLYSDSFEEIQIKSSSVEKIEEYTIKEALENDNFELSKEKKFELYKGLMTTFGTEKGEGEKVYDYEARVIEAIDRLMEKN